MKKFLLIFLGIILLLLIAIYGLLFSQMGNKYIAEYAQNIVDKELSGLVIKDFYLRPSELNLELEYDGMIDFKISGDLKLASLGLNLVYSLTSKNLELVDIMGLIKIDGTVAGNYGDIKITANGEVFKSPLSASATVLKDDVADIALNISELDLGKIAKIAGFGVLEGSLSADVAAPNLAALGGKLHGNMKFLPAADELAGIGLSKLQNIDISANAAADEQGVLANMRLWSNALFINISDVRLSNGDVSANLNAGTDDISWINENLKSDLSLAAKLNMHEKLLKITATAEGSNVKMSDMSADVDLGTMSAETNAKIAVNAAILGLARAQMLDASGKLKLKNGALSDLQVRGITLGGHLIAKLADNRLSASIKHASIDQALVLAQAPLIANGFFDVEANIKDLSAGSGKITASAEAKTNAEFFEQAAGLAVLTPIKIDADANLKSFENINFQAVAKSGLLDEFRANGSFKNGELNAKYSTFAALENFNKLLERKMSGEIALEGDLSFKNALEASARSTKLLGAKLEAQLKGDRASVTISNANISNFAKAFDFADVYDANANMRLDYDISKLSGVLDGTLKEGHLQPIPALKIINTVTKRNIENIVFNDGKFHSDIGSAAAGFNAVLNAEDAQLLVENGEFVFESGKLAAPLVLTLGQNTFKGRVEGDGKGGITYKPDAANAAANVLKLVDKKFGKGGAGGGASGAKVPDLSSKEGRKDAAKKLLKGLIK